MPAPPPPPPPSGLGNLKAPKLGGGSPDDRGALLQSIRQGAKLKKTVTVDKSGPCIPGKETKPTSSGSAVGNGSAPKASPATMNGGPPGLGGLFAGGMPKLRPTGMGMGGALKPEPKTAASVPPPRPVSSAPTHSSTLMRKPTQSPDKSKSPSPLLQQPKSKSPSPQTEQARVPGGPSVSHLTQVLGQALTRGSEPPKPPEARNSIRGPPPQPPAPNRPNLNLNTSDSTAQNRLQNLTTTDSVSPSVVANPPSLNISSIQPNASSLHKTNNRSSVNLGGSSTPNKINPLPSPTFVHNSVPLDDNGTNKVINHGKPNVAPKPPGIVVSPNGQMNNGKQLQSPKKQLGFNGRHASRSQSVRVPRSPPVTPPCPPSNGTEFSNTGFASMKINAFHQSHDSIDRKPLPGLAKNTAPQPPPMFGTRTLGRAPVRPPAHCPPPPPSRPLNQPPPPPPPHRQTSQTAQHARSNSTPNVGPPQPPVRHSSMRASELDSRFSDKFRTVDKFPYPDAFLRIQKTYSSVGTAVAAINNNIVSKQQAPMPPITHIQLTTKLWANNSSNC